MKIFDMHIHSRNTGVDSERILAEMDKAGIYGGCVFSNHPEIGGLKGGTPFEERLAEALAWSKGHEDRLFPVLRIHPYEDNIMEKLRIAKEAGILAIKIICLDFYVYEERCMEVLREIARLGMPVIFHTGILWDGEPSSDYNRPGNWEALINIEGLKFSMGHCSWPWIDECVALYGKFLNALNKGKSAEMFFDLTPGTPEIYRKELLTKIYTVGYNVGDNVMFGTDANAYGYRSEWAKNWLEIDRKILDELGVSLENREKMYSKNLMRFLGISDCNVEKEAPVPDDSHVWSPLNPSVPDIIEKWYKKLGFSKCYDQQFEEALEQILISDAITIENYDLKCRDGKRNLLSFLFLCEELEKKYREASIPEEILLDTLRDIPIWTREWTRVKGELYLGELSWLKRHFNMRLFRLGRLQFCLGEAECDVPKINLSKGDKVIEVHIPSGEKLDPVECEKSLELARKFFSKHFPDYEYSYFVCHSWLLDPSLEKYLSKESNILKFQNMFDLCTSDDSNALLRYIFKWDTNEENLPCAVCNSAFSEKIKRAVMSGESFHEVLGAIKR